MKAEQASMSFLLPSATWTTWTHQCPRLVKHVFQVPVCGSEVDDSLTPVSVCMADLELGHRQ